MKLSEDIADALIYEENGDDFWTEVFKKWIIEAKRLEEQKISQNI